MPNLEVPLTLLSGEIDGDIHFGRDRPPTSKRWRLRVGTAPLALSMRKHLGAEAVAKWGSHLSRFDLWLVPHRVAVVPEGGAKASAVGIEVEFLPEGQTCSVLALVPAFQFHVVGKVSGAVGVDIDATGKVDLGGVAAAPGKSIEGNVDVAARGAGGVHLNFRHVFAKAHIQASGVGAARCAWRLERMEEPLEGRDIETWSVVAVSKHATSLKHRVQGYVESRGVWRTLREESAWVDLECQK